MYAMNAIELSGYFAELFGIDDLEELVGFGAEPVLGHAVGLGHRLVHRLDARILAGPGLNLSGEDNGCRRGTADYRRAGALKGEDLELLVQRAGKDHVCATVIARDDAKNHRALEIDDCSADLSAIFQLQPPHRFGRAVEADKLARITTGRLLLAALMARATFFDERGKRVPAVHWSGPSAGTKPSLDTGCDSMPMRHTGMPPRCASHTTAVSADRMPDQRSKWV